MVKFTASVDVNSVIECNVRVGIQLPKIGQKGRDAKKSLKWGGEYVKKGERSQKVGGMFEMQKVVCESKSKKKIH